MQKTALSLLPPALLGFFVRRVLAAETTILVELKLVGSVLFIFCRGVIALLALGASQGNDIPHGVVLQPPPLSQGEEVLNVFTR